jgi:hypothetical protein
MIEDMTHLAVMESLAKELMECLLDYNRKTSGITDKTTLIAMRLEQSDVLTEILRKQRRHLRFMNGEKIEPEIHYAECTIVGIGGMEAQ